MASKSGISLCIPAYKAENHLPKLLQSAREQSYLPFDEIIVCVDASPDKSADVAASFGATVVLNEVNLGCSATKNRALEHVKSEWVHFHDADDLLLENFTLDVCSELDRKPWVDVLVTGFEYKDYTTGEIILTSHVNQERLEKDPVRYSIEHKLPNFGVYRTKKLKEIGGFDCDPAVLYNEDVAFHFKLAFEGLKFSCSNTATSINYKYSSSMSQSNQYKCAKAHFEVMRRAANVLGKDFGKEIAMKLWSVATHLVMHGDTETASVAIDLAKSLHPSLALGQNRTFVVLCHLIGAKNAYLSREFIIRRLKPGLRVNAS